jgi:hypothetical protein
MKSVLPICAVALPLFFASCASKWTEAQKSQLNSLAVAPSVASDAYKGPIGNQQYSAPIMATGGGGFAEGAAVGAAAQLIVEIAALAEQKAFESRYADAISRVPGTVPGDLGNRIRKEVGKSLGSHAFLKGKISDASPNRFVVTVETYRYVRAAKEDDVLVTPAIGGKFELITADGKKLLTNDFLATGTTAKSLNAFASDKALASRAFDEAISRVGLQAYNAIGRKLGETALAESSPTPATNSGQPLQLEGVSNLTASCNNPYKLTRDCNAFTGAGRKITVNGRKLKIAGSTDGKVVLVRDAALIPGNSVSSTGSPQYDAVRDTLRAAGVKILRQRDLMNPGNKAGGFYLEMDRDGYSVLAAH